MMERLKRGPALGIDSDDFSVEHGARRATFAAARATSGYCRVMFFRFREASDTVGPFLTACAR